MRAHWLALGLLVLGAWAAHASAGEHVVSQRGKQFEPGTLRVHVGDRVTFSNDDAVAHNVFATDAPAKFNLKLQKPGEAKEPVVFATPGTVTVRCAIHPAMKLVVTVE